MSSPQIPSGARAAKWKNDQKHSEGKEPGASNSPLLTLLMRWGPGRELACPRSWGTFQCSLLVFVPHPSQAPWCLQRLDDREERSLQKDVGIYLETPGALTTLGVCGEDVGRSFGNSGLSPAWLTLCTCLESSSQRRVDTFCLSPFTTPSPVGLGPQPENGHRQ